MKTQRRPLDTQTAVLKNQRGVALMISLFAMIFMMFIATQVSYETQVEYVSSSQEVNKLKAFYAAKAGMELSLFRIALYQNVRAGLSSQIESNPQLTAMINQIWQFPFSWPPVLPEGTSSLDQDSINDTVKESFMDSQYVVTIQAEDGKIDLNDMGSEVEELSKAAQGSLLQIFKSKIDSDDNFREKYQNENFEELVNNIADWVDIDTKGRNSSAENQGYEIPDDSNVQLPPNRAFRTLDELRMVKGMNDEFFNLIKDQVTVFGTKGINPNEASKKVIMSLDENITEEMVTKVMERRSSVEKGGPFKDDDDFYGFLESLGLRVQDLVAKNLPLYYNAAYNFHIISTGKSGNTRREIEAITMDLLNLSARYNSFLITPAPTNPGDPPANPTQPAAGNKALPYKAPKGRPTVVYWEES